MMPTMIRRQRMVMLYQKKRVTILAEESGNALLLRLANTRIFWNQYRKVEIRMKRNFIGD